MVSSSNVNKETLWRHLRGIKASSDRLYSDSDCNLFFLHNKYIMANLQNFSHFLNVSHVSNKVENFSDNKINEAGEMFLNLNSCPIDVEKAIDYWDVFYILNTFGKPVASILLTLLKTIEYSSEDGRKIAQTILEKLLLEMNVGKNEFERLTQAENYNNFKLLRGLKGILNTFYQILKN